MSKHPHRAAWKVPQDLGRRGVTKHLGTQSLTMHEMTREKISSLWFEGERPGWDLDFAASRRHREFFAGLQHTPSPAPSRQPACAFICMQSRGVPAHLHMQDVGAQSWKKKLSPKASDFQKK